MRNDHELEKILRATLRTRADRVHSGPEWSDPGNPRVVDRDDRSAAGMTMSRPGASSRRWRAPSLAAAAVVAVAVATSAIVTGGFGGSNNTATATGDVPVAVPIACRFTTVGAADGTSDGAADGNAPGGAAGRAAGSAAGHGPGRTSAAHHTAGSSVETDSCTSPGSVQLSFDGAPPEGTLDWVLQLGGHEKAHGTMHSEGHSTGAAPSYLSSGGALFDGSRYVWGAVGPNVAQVQIQAMQPAEPGATATLSPTSAFWMIGSGQGTEFSLPGQEDVVWTGLGHGWHGFAVQPPADTKQIDVTSLSPDGHAVETRRFEFTAGHRDWSELSPLTPAVTTGVAANGTGTDTPDSPSKTTALTMAPSTMPTPGSGSGATTPFSEQCPSTRETGTVAIPDAVRRSEGDWFGHDDLWVNAPRAVGAFGAKFATLTLDDHGEFTDSKGAPTLTARLLGSTKTAEMMDGTDYSMEDQGGYLVYFWPTTLKVQQTGTWLLTERLGDTTLRFCMTVG